MFPASLRTGMTTDTEGSGLRPSLCDIPNFLKCVAPKFNQSTILGTARVRPGLTKRSSNGS